MSFTQMNGVAIDEDWVLIREVNAGSSIVGRPSELYRMRTPACFYKIEVPAYNGRPAVHLGFGSGPAMYIFAGEICIALASGMLEID